MNRQRLSRPSLKIMRHSDTAQPSTFLFEIWSPFTGSYQTAASIENGLHRVRELADLINQMWLQKHPKRDMLADAPSGDPHDGARVGDIQWAELRINATVYRSYDTRQFGRTGWARSASLEQAAATICRVVGYPTGDLDVLANRVTVLGLATPRFNAVA